MPEVTAILVASDEMAFGVLRALNELGRRVPEDVSVVGIDDIDLAAFSNPPLTTIRQSFEDTGRRAVLRLVAQIANPDLASTARAGGAHLVVRGSTAPPPAGSLAASEARLGEPALHQQRDRQRWGPAPGCAHP